MSECTGWMRQHTYTQFLEGFSQQQRPPHTQHILTWSTNTNDNLKKYIAATNKVQLLCPAVQGERGVKTRNPFIISPYNNSFCLFPNQFTISSSTNALLFHKFLTSHKKWTTSFSTQLSHISSQIILHLFLSTTQLNSSSVWTATAHPPDPVVTPFPPLHHSLSLVPLQRGPTILLPPLSPSHFSTYIVRPLMHRHHHLFQTNLFPPPYSYILA